MIELDVTQLQTNSEDTGWDYIRDNDYAEQLIAETALVMVAKKEEFKFLGDRGSERWEWLRDMRHNDWVVFWRKVDESNSTYKKDEIYVWQVHREAFDELVEAIKE